MEEVLLLNEFFSDCRYVPYLRRYSPSKLCMWWRPDGDFWRLFASSICSEPQSAHFRPAF